MTYLGEDSVSMAKLTHLYLDHMALQDLSEQALSDAPLLSHLDISHNQLQYLEPLKGPKNMRSLNLTGTQVYFFILIHGGHDDNLIRLKGNPLYCNCYIRPLRKWAKVSGVKLLGACAGPAHLADELLEAVALLNLRCRSRGEVLKDEFEKADERAEVAPPTAKPKPKVKCPVNCHCNVSHFCRVCLSLRSCFLLSTSLHPALAPCLI